MNTVQAAGRRCCAEGQLWIDSPYNSFRIPKDMSTDVWVACIMACWHAMHKGGCCLDSTDKALMLLCRFCFPRLMMLP